MISIKQILDGLGSTDRSALLIAFEGQETYYVEYAPGYWVGVNTDACPHLSCNLQAGDWRAGTINREANNDSVSKNKSS